MLLLLLLLLLSVEWRCDIIFHQLSFQRYISLLQNFPPKQKKEKKILLKKGNDFIQLKFHSCVVWNQNEISAFLLKVNIATIFTACTFALPHSHTFAIFTLFINKLGTWHYVFYIGYGKTTWHWLSHFFFSHNSIVFVNILKETKWCSDMHWEGSGKLENCRGWSRGKISLAMHLNYGL
jgi:hypothetical protein